MYKVFRYRLFPTKRQVVTMLQVLDECRWLYNYFLDQRRNFWTEQKKSLSYYAQIKSIPELKKSRPNLVNIYSQILLDVAKRVDLAFKAFFRRIKTRSGKAGYPRFKSTNRYDSFTYPQSGFKITNNGLKLSKIGTIKIKLHRPIEGKIKTCTVRRTATGKWFVTFSCEVPTNPLPKSSKAIGIDVGLENFATLSNGEIIENPRFFKTDQKALAKAQRKLSKQKKGTPEREKARKVVARIYERISNRRHNFIHQVSRKIVNRFGIICVEKLNIKDIQSGNFRSINRSIADVAWGQFARVLASKAEEAGRKFIAVDPRNTSQRCSQCGAIVRKDLSVRWYECPICGCHLHRDINASLNILALGLQGLGTQSLEAQDGVAQITEKQNFFKTGLGATRLGYNPKSL